ncbi:MAG TPA: nucleotidyltransferase family protein [Candidatus Acidoferrum sp.]|nr:nucleotidyltransferase family protein [Candidatus Acidoferrum sp.]
MKAMILAAGLGTRLRPLTDTIPKALVELNGRTLLEILITRLKSFGVTEIIVNVHHHAEKIVSFLQANSNFGLRIELSREDDLLLDTGGGLKKAAWFFQEGNSGEPFLLHNVDVLSNIDFHQMLATHKKSSALATLAVQKRPSSRQLLFDQNNLLVGRSINATDALISKQRENPTDRHSERSEESAFSSDSFTPSVFREGPLPLAFSGIHIISPRLLNLITESGVFSIIDTYLRLSSSNEKISAFRADSFYWRDLGRLEDLSAASIDMQQRKLL